MRKVVGSCSDEDSLGRRVCSASTHQTFQTTRMLSGPIAGVFQRDLKYRQILRVLYNSGERWFRGPA